MKLHVHEKLPGLHPLHAYHRWRDEIVRRAAHLPHVRSLHERERTTAGRKLRRLLACAIDLEIPLMARALVPSDALLVELVENWDEEGLGGEWSLRSAGISEQAACATGRMRFGPEGLQVEGDVRLDLAALPQVPTGLAKGAGPALEQALARQIEHGWRLLARTIL